MHVNGAVMLKLILSVIHLCTRFITLYVDVKNISVVVDIQKDLCYRIFGLLFLFPQVILEYHLCQIFSVSGCGRTCNVLP